jgi:hypothetical protein
MIDIAGEEGCEMEDWACGRRRSNPIRWIVVAQIDARLS